MDEHQRHFEVLRRIDETFKREVCSEKVVKVYDCKLYDTAMCPATCGYYIRRKDGEEQAEDKGVPYEHYDDWT